jgi:hypothetical protein
MTKDLLREYELAKLALAIKNHDHYYNMSEDHGVWRRGVADREDITQHLEEMFSKRSEQLEFWNEHAPKGCGYTQAYIDELKSQGK